MSTMHVVFSSDERYVPHMGVAITSILLNSLESDRFCFNILSDGISPGSVRKLESLSDIRSFDMRVIDVGPKIKDAIKGVNTISWDTRITEASYYRLMTGSIFPDLDRILYLDCDLVVLNSLDGIWGTDLSGHTIAAVEEILDPPQHRDTFMEFPRYFNSGVLLFNLSRWRELGYEKKCLDIGEDLLDLVAHHDQSILNCVFREGDLRYLGAEYNYLIGFKKHFSRSKDPVKKGVQPVVVHYAGPKPWLLDSLLDRRIDLACFEHYWRYWEQSPWADSPAAGRIIVRDVCRYLWRHPKDIPTAIRRIGGLKKLPYFSGTSF